MPKALKITLVIIAILTLLVALGLLKEHFDDIEDYNDALKDFNEICEYVKENEEHFITISEHEMSKLTEETQYILLETQGEYQESRDIVFYRFYVATAYVNTITGKGIVQYGAQANPCYHISVIYSDDISIGITDDSTTHIISDDIRVSLLYDPKYE